MRVPLWPRKTALKPILARSWVFLLNKRQKPKEVAIPSNERHIRHYL